MIRNVTHTKTPPDAVLLMELGSLLVSGDLPSWSQNELGARWKCGRGVVRRIATLLANQYRTMTGPAANHYRTTLAECFSHLASTAEPAPNQHRTSTEPTRARSSSKSKKEKEKEKEKNNTPAKPAVDSVVSDVWSKLEAIRKQYEPKARTWPKTGETANKRRKAIKARLKALNSDGHEDPIQTMLDTASWLYGPTDSFKAKGCRKGGIDSMLRPSNMLELTNIRLDEQANPNKTNGNTRSAGAPSTGADMRTMFDNMREPERVVIDAPLRLETT